MSVAIVSSSVSSSAPNSAKNYLLNSNLDFFLTGISTVTVNSGLTSYVPGDLWYVTNNGVASGGIDASGTAGPLIPPPDGLNGRLRVVCSGNVTGYVGSPFQLAQVLDNPSSQELSGQTVSAGVWILAQGNVTQVGLQFLTEASEVRPITTTGAEQLTSVNAGTFTFCKLEGISLPSISGGVFAVRVRVTGVSSGDLGDDTNGFVVGKSQWNPTPTVSPFYQRAGATLADELLLINRFYCKSYESTTNPSAVTDYGLINGTAVAATTATALVGFPVEMRVRPSIVFYSRNGTADAFFNASINATNVGPVSPADAVGSITTASTQGLLLLVTGTATLTAGDFIMFHYTADARI